MQGDARTLSFPEVTACLAAAGSEILCVPNGSPFEAGKEDVRLKLAGDRVQESGLPLIYLNQLGGQDEVVFDGASFVLNADKSVPVALMRDHKELTVTVAVESEESLRRTGYFDVAAVRHWRKAFRQMRAGSLPRLSVEMGLVAVVATQLWHHLFIDGALSDLPTWTGLAAAAKPAPQA